MCISPIIIANPNFRQAGIGISQYKNCETSRIQVPCGHCPQCIALRQGFYNQRVQMESLRSHLFMFTLTYNNESLRYTDIGQYQIPYPDITDVQNMFKRMRKSGLKFSYTFVSEYGTNRHRPHFHGIIAIRKSLSNKHYSEWESILKKLFLHEWRRNYGSTRSPLWLPLFTYQRRFTKQGLKTNFDLHYIESVENHDNDVSFYVSKYLTKHDKRTSGLLSKISMDNLLTVDEQTFLKSLIRPRSYTSKDFGSKHDPIIKHYILSHLTYFKESIPQFIDINSGRSMMLSPYYASLVPIQYHTDRWFNSGAFLESDSFYTPPTDNSLDTYQTAYSKLQIAQKFDKTLNIINSHLDDSFF